jgi:hypothetical protein
MMLSFPRAEPNHASCGVPCAWFVSRTTREPAGSYGHSNSSGGGEAGVSILEEEIIDAAGRIAPADAPAPDASAAYEDGGPQAGGWAATGRAVASSVCPSR